MQHWMKKSMVIHDEVRTACIDMHAATAKEGRKIVHWTAECLSMHHMLTFTTREELLMLCAGVQHPFKLQLTELSQVDNICWQAIPQWVVGSGKGNGTAATAADGSASQSEDTWHSHMTGLHVTAPEGSGFCNVSRMRDAPVNRSANIAGEHILAQSL